MLMLVLMMADAVEMVTAIADEDDATADVDADQGYSAKTEKRRRSVGWHREGNSQLFLATVFLVLYHL